MQIVHFSSEIGFFLHSMQIVVGKLLRIFLNKFLQVILNLHTMSIHILSVNVIYILFTGN